MNPDANAVVQKLANQIANLTLEVAMKDVLIEQLQAQAAQQQAPAE